MTRNEISMGAGFDQRTHETWAHETEKWQIFSPNMRTRVEFIAFL